MKQMIRSLLTLMVACTLLPAAALAAGSGSAPTPSSSRPAVQPKTPQEQAVEHFNTGIRMRDKAWKLEDKMLAAPDEKKVKIGTKIDKTYKMAIKEFKAAAQKNPRMHQAYGSLGYALRKTGQYEDALVAYDHALNLEPSYVEAIEYRAEAYLGLGRLEEAKQAYMKLFRIDRENADTLMTAMQKWVEKRSMDPGNLSAGKVNDFAGWVEERAGVARQTASLTQQQKRKW